MDDFDKVPDVFYRFARPDDIDVIAALEASQRHYHALSVRLHVMIRHVLLNLKAGCLVPPR